MANKEIELQSGAKLNITTAPFSDANALLKALVKSAHGIKLAENPWETDLSGMKDALLNAVTSDEAEAALFRCFQRVSYDGQKITRDLLDDPKMGDKLRQDYYLVCWHVIDVNCRPFLGQAFSLLRERQKTQAAAPKPS